MFRALLIAIVALCATYTPQSASAQDLQALLQSHAKIVAKPSRKTVGPVIDDMIASGLPSVPGFLEHWAARDVWQRAEDGLFFRAVKAGDGYDLLDLETGDVVQSGVEKDALKQSKPNGGVRKVIATALVQFQLSNPDPTVRRSALDALARDLDSSQIDPLRLSLEGEDDTAILARKTQLLSYLEARFGDTTERRVAALRTLGGDVSLDTRAVFSQILTTEFVVTAELPVNAARIFSPGDDLSIEDAYAALVTANLAEQIVDSSQIKAGLEANIVDGQVAGTPIHALNTDAARRAAYDALAQDGKVAALTTPEAITAAVQAHNFYDRYIEDDADVLAAALEAQTATQTRVSVGQTADIIMDALSLASIYFLAAIGLAITFGVMGVINMAHGEFIMMGAYTGYVVQLFIPDYTLSLIVALPLAFAVTFGAGVVMERLVIRHLYHRPLETLLATFGISIALQQLAKNIFGTQARPLTSPAWLDGAWVLNDVVQISYIRVAIFVLALIFLAFLLFMLNRTRLGLEVRAVTQNPGMAASMGINPNRINMLTFGLGSGIAGIAGVAIGLYAKVTSEMGADYIVQSFMTVVVGGVGNVWGTLAGAGMIGSLQKGIEWLNPSNTLAAQTYMILFIILFIQFRPKGIVALKGRAAGD